MGLLPVSRMAAPKPLAVSARCSSQGIAAGCGEQAGWLRLVGRLQEVTVR